MTCACLPYTCPTNPCQSSLMSCYILVCPSAPGRTMHIREQAAVASPTRGSLVLQKWSGVSAWHGPWGQDAVRGSMSSSYRKSRISYASALAKPPLWIACSCTNPKVTFIEIQNISWPRSGGLAIFSAVELPVYTSALRTRCSCTNPKVTFIEIQNISWPRSGGHC